MPNYRDAIRQKEAESANVASTLGINLADMRLDSRGGQATGAVISRLANASTPTPGTERIYQDDFAGQTFNGTNTEFTISRSVFGQNIMLNRVEQSTGTLMPLRRTTNPAPGGDEFWFDGFFTVRVGTAPGSFDALLATYITRL